MDFTTKLQIFAIIMRTSTWIIRARWRIYLFLIGSWSVMSALSIANCKPQNLKIMIPSLGGVLILICLSFAYFTRKMARTDPKDLPLKGPTIIPACLCTDVLLPLAFLTMPCVVFFTGYRNVAGLFISILFVPIASFFQFAVVADAVNVATQAAIGTSAGLCVVMVSLYGVKWAFAPGAVAVVVGFGFFMGNQYLRRRMEEELAGTDEESG